MNEPDFSPYMRALGSDDAFGALVRLVLQFKRAGGTEKQALDLLQELRVRSGSYDAEDARDDLITDVMDCVGGWCSRNNYIFAEEFDEAHFFRQLPPAA